jgi:hypothetical protein
MISVSYRAFFLNPDIPPEGYDFRAYMPAKGGGQIPLEQFFTGPREMGAQVGLTFNIVAGAEAGRGHGLPLGQPLWLRPYVRWRTPPSGPWLKSKRPRSSRALSR